MNCSTQRTCYPGALFQWLHTASTERVITRQLLRINEDLHANRALCQVSHLFCGVYAASRHFVGLLTTCNDQYYVQACNVRKITGKLVLIQEVSIEKFYLCYFVVKSLLTVSGINKAAILL